MKKIILAFALLLASYTIDAQVKTPAPSPKSSLEQTVGLTKVAIEYSRPSMKGRTIFGDLVRPTVCSKLDFGLGAGVFTCASIV